MQGFNVKDKIRFLQASMLELNIAVIEREEKKRNPLDCLMKVYQAISNGFYNQKPQDDLKEIKEAIADIEISLREIRLYYKIPKEEINAIINNNVSEKLELYKKVRSLQKEVNKNEKI